MKTIYQLTKSNLSGKRFGLISQMKDAAIGLPSCIAGNLGRRTAKDKKPFIDNTTGLLNATHLQLIVPDALEYMGKERLENTEPFVEKRNSLCTKI